MNDEEEEVYQSPVHVILSQSRSLKPGLGSSKPTKKRLRRRNTPSLSNSSSASDSPNTTTGSSSASGSNPISVSKPNSIICKKRNGMCSDEIVFEDHYNKIAWLKYANYVRNKKSSIDIDPEYIPC